MVQLYRSSRGGTVKRSQSLELKVLVLVGFILGCSAFGHHLLNRLLAGFGSQSLDLQPRCRIRQSRAGRGPHAKLAVSYDYAAAGYLATGPRKRRRSIVERAGIT